MRAIPTVFLLTLLAGLAIADEKAGDAVKAKDQAQLQGLWQAVAMEANGAKAPDDEIQRFQLLFKEGKLTFNPKADNREHAFEIDAAAKPKALDVIPGDGVKKGTKLPCAIYELTGDKLVFCINKEMTGDKRPTQFKTAPGDGMVLITLERVKPVK
ncbi:MAG TPA: TIGR03067 domain-containing protein [Pirellulales bacterium]|jgi:uncharacterized protein (TIGR03067 family)